MSINNIRKQIDVSLGSFLEKSNRKYDLESINPKLYESIRDFTLREGKRIRPLLFILSYKGYEKRSSSISRSVYNASICIELLHNFMLIHDDIIDRSDLRRGKPTMHILLGKAAKTKEEKTLGHDLGIVAGDIVYAMALEALLSIKCPLERKENALKYFVQATTFTAMGEYIDTINGSKRIDQVSEKDVLLNYSLKTAKYTFDCPLVMGAMIAGAEKKDLKKLSEFGINIGQAFQIQDDILGIFGSEKGIGKSILSDLAESKKTLLVCHAFEHLKGKTKKDFLKYFSKPKKTYKDLVAVRKIFIKSGSLQYSLDEIKKRINLSVKILDKLNIDRTYRDLIKESLLTLFKYSDTIAAEHT